jgi:hypothetical protein
MLSIPPINPGDHHIDSITHGTSDLLHIAHHNLLEPCALGHELILGEGNRMINLSKMDSPRGVLGGSRSRSAL